MKKLTVLTIFIIILLVNLSAQNIGSWIDSKKPLLFEKLYVQVDREYYAPGDIIWLKVYQVNGITHKLNSNFRNIFVQLVAEDGRIVKDLMLFSIKGQTQGEFNTDSVKSGIYTIRAFTKYLENFGEEACFHKKIWITKSSGSVDPTGKDQTDYSKIDVSFLPEGGTLVLNAVNTVAFKAIDARGKGIFVSGKIRNEQGDAISPFSTSYLGMGKFNLMPEDGKTYYAFFDQNPELKIRLPQAKENGICLNYKEKGEALMFTITANMKLNKYPGFYFVASHKGTVLFYQKLGMAEFSKAVNLNKNLFPEGISKITLLDTTLIPITERLIFVDNDKSDLLSLRLSQTEFKPREEVKIDVEALLDQGDSVNSNLSVAVVNKNYICSGGNSQNIKSYLLLDSDLKGAIESPSSYFVDDELHKSAEKLDLLMLVHGWISYLWDDVEKNPNPSIEDWNDAGIEIKGYVKRVLWEAPLANAELTLASNGGKFVIEKTTSNEQGRFNFERVYLRNITKVMIDAKTKSGTRNAEIILDPRLKKDSVISAESLKNTCLDLDLNANFNQSNSFRMKKNLGFNPEMGSILLGDVDIVEKRVVKDDGHFRLYTTPDNSLTVKKEDFTYNNVVEYLEGKVAGVNISGDQISIRGGGTPLFLIDGIEVSDFPPGSGSALREIKSIHMGEVDKVEVLKSAGNTAIYGSKGGNGVIAIYRKNTGYTEYDNYVKGRITASIRGFHKAQKFYSPTYSFANINNPQPDFRPTLYWNPELSFKDNKANIGFFTSDELTQYVVMVEGISKNGKICFGTTDFTVNKKE